MWNNLPYDNNLNILDVNARIGTHNGDGDYTLSFVKNTKTLNLNDEQGVKSSVVIDIDSGAGTFLPLTGGIISGDLKVNEELSIGDMTIKDEYANGGDNLVNIKCPRPVCDIYTGGSKVLTLNTGTSIFTSDINLGNKRIYTSLAPNFNSDLTNLLYVNNRVNTRLALTGGTMAGGIAMANNRITGLLTGQNDNEATTKKYVDDAITTEGEKYLPLIGGTLTGSTQILSSNQATYGFSQKNNDVELTTYINTTQGAYIGTRSNDDLLIFTNGRPSTETNCKFLKDKTTTFENNRVINVGTPTEDNDATNKKYVDDAISGELLQSFKTYNITGKQFNNYGQWGGILSNPEAFYTKPTRMYIPITPLVSTEIINDSIIKSNAYILQTTPKINPSLFQFYGIVYQDLTVSTIKKGRLQVKLNIPYINDRDITNDSTFMAQGILGKAPTFNGNNIEVLCYATETVNSVHNYRGDNMYGNNIDDVFPNNDNKSITEMELLFNFNIPLDIPANNIYIYIQFSTSLASSSQSSYINFVFGGLTSPLISTNSRDLLISGTSTYTKQNTDVIKIETPIDASFVNIDTSTLEDEHFHYTLNNTNYEPVKTFNNINVIEQRDISNEYIHAVEKQVSSGVEEIALLNNGANPGIFDASNILTNDIFDCDVKLKTDILDTDISINAVIIYFDNEDDEFIDAKILNFPIYLLRNTDNYNRYVIPLSKLLIDKYLISITLQLPAGLKIALDNFEIHYVDNTIIREKHAYFTVNGNTTVLQSANEDDKKDLTDRVNELETYIAQLKQTYTIEEP